MEKDELKIVALIDTTQFEQDVKGIRESLENLVAYANELGGGTKTFGDNLTVGVSGLEQVFEQLGGLTALKDFATNVVEVAGDLQRLEVMLTSVLGSASLARETMSLLSDFSLTASIPINELAEAYINLSNQGFIPSQEEMMKLCDLSSVTGQTLGHLAEVMVNALSGQNEGLKDFGIQVTETGDKSILMFRGQQTVVESTTDTIKDYILSLGEMEGVQGATAEMAKTLGGSLLQIQNKLSNELNDFGNRYKEVFELGLDSTLALAGQLGNIIRVISGAVVALGAYKTVVLLIAAAHKAQGFVDNIRLIMMFRKELGMATAAQQAFNMASKANVYIAGISILAGLITTIAMFVKSTNDATDAQEQYNREQELAAERERAHKENVDSLISAIGNVALSEMDRIGAMQELKRLYPGIIEKYIDEEGHLRNIADLNKEIAEFDARRKVEKHKIDLRSINDRVRNQEEYVMNMTGSEEAKQEASDALGRLQQQQNKAQNQVNTDSLKERLAEAAKMSNEELLKTISLYERGLAETTGDHIGDFSKAEVNSVLESMKQIQKARESTPRDKSYWTKQRENAEIELNKIDSKQRELLNAGKFKGIDPAVVQNFKKQNELLNHSEKELKVYDKPKKISNSRNKELEEQQSLAEELSQLQLMNKQDEINLIADAAERKRAQILFDYEKECAIIKAKEQKLKELQNGKLTDEQRVVVKKGYDNAAVRLGNAQDTIKKEDRESAQAKADAEKQSSNDYYKAYGDYSQQKNAIVSDYGDKISKAQTEGEKAILGKEMQNDLQEVERAMIEQSSLWINLFSDASEQTSGFIQKSIEEAEQLMQYLAGEEGVEMPVGIDKEQLEALKKDPEQIKKIFEGLKDQRDALNQRNPFTALIQGFKDLKEAASNTDLTAGMKDQKLASGTQSIISGMQGVSSILGEVGGALESMGGKSSESFNGVAEVLGKTASMASTGASIAGPWGAAAGAAIGLATSLTSVFAKSHDNKREKEIEKLQEQIEVLDKAYNKLGEAIEQSYSKDASNLIEQQNQMLEQQKVLIQGQIREEQDKKKADSGRIEEWQAQIEEINNTIAQNKVKAQDAIFGADVKSAIDEFAQAYADAWAAGNDRAKAMKDVVKGMIKGVIVEMLKSDLAPTVQKIRDRIESMLADGVISSYEQLELDKMIEEETAKADKKYAWGDEYLKDEEKSASQESSKGGFTAMSQDSADELNGRFTALQMAGEELKFQSTQQSGYLLGMSVNLDVVKLYTQGIAVNVAEMKDIALTSMSHLSTIEKNTRQLYQMNERLGSIEQHTKRL